MTVSDTMVSPLSRTGSMGESSKVGRVFLDERGHEVCDDAQEDREDDEHAEWDTPFPRAVSEAGVPRDQSTVWRKATTAAAARSAC